MATACRHFLRYKRTSASLFNPFPYNGANFTPHPHSSRFSSKSQPPYAVKVGVPEFLNGVGSGLEARVAKIESEIGDFNKLLVARTLGLKKLSIPCKHRKLILKYTHKYRLGLWRPRIDAPKS